jgi:hypothetical protein
MGEEEKGKIQQHARQNFKRNSKFDKILMFKKATIHYVNIVLQLPLPHQETRKMNYKK